MSLRAPCCSVDGRSPLRSAGRAFLLESAGQHKGRVCARRLGHLVERNRSRNMTTMLIRNAEGIFTGLPDDVMRATGATAFAMGGSLQSANSLQSQVKRSLTLRVCHLSGSRIDAPPPFSEHPQRRSRGNESAADGLVAFGPAFLLA